MNDIKKLTKDIITYALVCAGVLAFVFFLFFRGNFPALLLGLLFGVSVSIFNFIDLSTTIQRSVDKSPAQAQSYTVKKYFIRYIINGVVIYIAVVTPYIHIVSTVLGMLLIKVVIMVTNLFNDKQFYMNIFKRKEV